MPWLLFRGIAVCRNARCAALLVGLKWWTELKDEMGSFLSSSQAFFMGTNRA
jgi:hypothetical protein